MILKRFQILIISKLQKTKKLLVYRRKNCNHFIILIVKIKFNFGILLETSIIKLVFGSVNYFIKYAALLYNL